MLVPWLLLPVALVGLLDALYFVAITYRWMAPDARIVPSVCRMDERSCASIVDTRWARVLGLPNSVYGAAFYVVILAAAIAMLLGRAVPCTPLLVASGGTVAVSVLLFWSLIWRLKTRCPLCFLGHAINVAIFGLLAWACA